MTEMQLGVNFRPSPRSGLGFNSDAVRALRPTLVRHVLTNPADLPIWIRSAEQQGLSVLWSVPIEQLGPAGTILALFQLVQNAQHVTGGLEIGTAPWKAGLPPGTFLAQALATIDVMSMAPIGGAVPRFPWPLILGAGIEDTSRQSRLWLAGLLSTARRYLLRGRFQGLGVTAVTPGRPPRRWFLNALAFNLARLELRPSFIRVGWPLGMELRWWTGVRETYRRSRDTGTRQPVWHLDTWVRRRWLLEAYELARQLGALHFILEAEPGGDGLQEWGLYDAHAGRPDPAWYALQWRHARHEPALKAAV